MWTPGQRLRNRPYQIENLLGQGGFGLTYKARHLQLNHLVVIKTPNPGLQNDPEYPNFLQRFIKEGQILAQLSEKAHPSMQNFIALMQRKPPIVVNTPTPKMQPLNQPQTVKLISAKGIDYSSLETMLANGNWKDADQETAKKMLEIAGREKEGWVKVDDINSFPVQDLRTIDQLWTKYSNGRFGFSVQKRIYETLGETQNYDKKTWEEFGDLVGWRVNNAWLWSPDIKYTSDAPIGHLPSFSGCAGVGVWVFGLGRGVVRGKCIVRLYFHLDICKV